jgi:hypothetical protein
VLCAVGSVWRGGVWDCRTVTCRVRPAREGPEAAGVEGRGWRTWNELNERRGVRRPGRVVSCVKLGATRRVDTIVCK